MMMRGIIGLKKAAKYLLLPLGWGIRAVWPRRDEVIILMYHRVCAGVGKELAVTPADFAWHLDYLRRHHYAVIPLDRAWEMLRAGTVRGKSVVLTFDDGYADYDQNARPLLEALGYPSTLYLVPGWIGTGRVFPWDRDSGESPLLGWERLRQLAATGLVSFGSHTLDHIDLAGLDEAALDREVAGSRRLLEQRLKQPVRHFAYPRGISDGLAERWVGAHYQTGVLISTGRRVARTIRPEDRVRLKRVPIQNSDGRRLFVAKLKGWLIGEEWLRQWSWRLLHRPARPQAAGAGPAPRRCRLLMGVTLSELGGAQKVVFELLKSLGEDEYETTVATAPGGELLQWIAQLNAARRTPVRVVLLPSLRREIAPWNDLRTLFRLWRLCRAGKYDVAHFHSSKMGILGPIAAFAAGVKRSCFSVHGWGIQETQGRVVRAGLGLLVRLANSLCAAVACVSEATLQQGLRNHWLDPRKSRVIHNGLAEAPAARGKLRRELGIGAATPVLGTILRLAEQKEPLAPVRLARLLRERGREFRLVIIGDGPLQEECRREIRRCGLEAVVLLLGTRHDARELLNDFDIALLFSRWEALPLMVIEAMLAGKPVVASRVGGLPELVRHGATGYLVGDDQLETAAAYVEELLDDAALRKRMGEAGRSLAGRQFSDPQMVAAYREMYRGEPPCGAAGSPGLPGAAAGPGKG
jgi:glycosyltransferase involved in cell wall biosynthesis/peptidoglycan/xylan/chitin deacetylase (PgdA/CDA1 family)